MDRNFYVEVVEDGTTYNKKHPVRLKGLGPKEQHFSLSEKECLDVIGGLVWGLQTMRKREAARQQDAEREQPHEG